MKSFAILFLLVFISTTNPNINEFDTEQDNSEYKGDINSSCSEEAYPSFSLSHCTSSFDDNVNTYELYDRSSKAGYSIWISRKSQRVSAKYFAYRMNGSNVNDRYNYWKSGKDVVLMSSGAYAVGNSRTIDKPVGITVDYGNVVNKNFDSQMDGLVIVYATGGIVVSNVEEGDLYLDALGGTLDIKDAYDRNKFLDWAQDEDATVFQTHLLVYKNDLQFVKNNGKTASRKFLVLAKTGSGELFHIIFYTKYKSYSLYDSASSVLNYLSGQNMDVIAVLNLDTGMYDILGTGGEAKDCSGYYLSGNQKTRTGMTNLLAYEFN